MDICQLAGQEEEKVTKASKEDTRADRLISLCGISRRDGSSHFPLIKLILYNKYHMIKWQLLYLKKRAYLRWISLPILIIAMTIIAPAQRLLRWEVVTDATVCAGIETEKHDTTQQQKSTIFWTNNWLSLPPSTTLQPVSIQPRHKYFHLLPFRLYFVMYSQVFSKWYRSKIV